MVDTFSALDAGAQQIDFAAFNDSGVLYPIKKVAWGADGAAVQTAAVAGQGLPVQGEVSEGGAVGGGILAVGGRRDTTPRSLADGERGEISLSPTGAQYFVQVDDAGNVLSEVGQAQDAPLTGGESGILAFGRFKATAAQDADTDGDVAWPIFGSDGRQWTSAKIDDFFATEYEAVIATISPSPSPAAQILGATGATGDYLSHITITPLATSPGGIELYDGSTIIWRFAGGASSLQTLHPFTVQFGIRSLTGAFALDVGANVECLAVGDFT